MAQSFVTDQGTLIIPGAYSSIAEAVSTSGVSTTGVLLIVAEADAGPDFSKETDLNKNSFGPDQVAAVRSKYKSGNLVNAFVSATAAANDAGIPGSFSRAILVKTNPSTRASGLLSNYASGTWGTILDRSYGKLGNLISRVVTAKQAEAVPTTGSFAYMPAYASTNVDFRVNGGAAQALTFAAAALPSTVKTAIDGLTGIDATGGTNRAILGSVTGTLALAIVSGNTVTITRSVAFSTTTTAAGDTLYIPADSVLASVHANNAGAYIVTGATTTTITARKLVDVSSAVGPTAPTAQGAISIDSTDDVSTFAPIEVKLTAASPTDGLGKSLEISALTSAAGLLTDLCYTLSAGVPAAVSWISTTAVPYVIASATEYIAKLAVSRQVDNLSEELFAGGAPVLLVSYTGTSGSLVNDGTTLTITVVGGAGSSPDPITLADFPTIADLATYISSLTGFKAAPGTAVLGAQPSTSLDQGTFTIGSTFGAYNGRIKQDAYRLFTKINNDSILIQMTTQPTAGLPAPQVLGFLSGGTKGATTDAVFNAAIDALELCRGNFVIPCFSRNASADVAAALTDPSSSYTIANVHSYTRSHVLKMSTLKRKRNRQAFLSMRDTFTVVRNTAANLASGRCSLTFEDVKDTGPNGIVQFQPWMAAIKAAAMQAAGFYRPIVRKNINISGALQAAGDFNSQNDTDEEDSLLAGLLPIAQDEAGGFYWVSDQTTYGGSSPLQNSIQAMYIADTVALSTAARMEKAFVGQSLADVGASMAMTTLEGIMGDMLRLKLLAKSDDAPAGFKNASVKIVGTAMLVNCEIKLAGAIYFIPISFLVSQVTQSA